ncbi:hypothetical protein BHM03_00029871, partial [Ensete ventricosum]
MITASALPLPRNSRRGRRAEHRLLRHRPFLAGANKSDGGAARAKYEGERERRLGTVSGTHLTAATSTCLLLLLHGAATCCVGGCDRRRPQLPLLLCFLFLISTLSRPIPYSPSPLGPRISLRVMATSSSTAAARHALSSFAVMILLAMSLSASRPSLTRAAAPWDPIIRLPSNRLAPEPGEGGRLDDEEETGTKWALLVAGSSGYGNYRHQADVCHAYQLLRRGGLREENIVVMMHDDIAHNPLNPRQGVIINHPQGQDVYAGVPKVHAHQWDSSVFVILNLSLDSRELVDFLVRPSLLCRGRNGQRTLGLSRCLQDYTKEQVTTKNLYAVLLGDRSAIEGGSGKVIDSKPDDRIFIYYSDHGGPGVKMRTSNHDTYNTGSHVMEYGDKSVKSDMLSLYQGFDPAIANVTENALRQRMPMGVINQRDADLLFMWKM